MGKNLSWAAQVQAAQEEVSSWPESVKSATNFSYSELFQQQDRTSDHFSEQNEQNRQLKTHSQE